MSPTPGKTRLGCNPLPLAAVGQNSAGIFFFENWHPRSRLAKLHMARYKLYLIDLIH